MNEPRFLGEMPQFYYEAIHPDGNKVKGTAEAPNRGEAMQSLNAKGLQPFVLQDTQETAGTASKQEKTGQIRLRNRDVIEFTEELGDLLHAGLQLEPALGAMSQRDDQSPIKRVIDRSLESLREGQSFSEALSKASPSFGPMYCTLAHAGEVSGSLPKILRRQGEHLKEMQDLKSKVVTSLIYPAVLVVFGIALCVLFMAFLIPRLTEMLDRSGAKLPPLASALIATSDFMREDGLMVLGILLVLGIVAWRVFSSKMMRPHWDRMQLRIPLIGPMMTTYFQVRFLETLANLLQNGIPLLRALELVQNTSQNLFIREKLAKTVDQVTDGMSLSRSLQLSGAFPRQLTDMLRIGEQSGQLSEKLSRIADKYDREISQRIANIGALIQPVIILMMAMLVGTMAYVMISVIYDSISTLRSR